MRVQFKDFYNAFVTISEYKHIKFEITKKVGKCFIHYDEIFTFIYEDFENSKNELLEKYGNYIVFGFWISIMSNELHILVDTE